MKAPLLSICIATYNRAWYIGETLDSIISQLDDDVELLVVDGASTDNTEDVVRKFAQKESRIRYIRLPAKGGVDQDFCKAVELAKGEYCWLMSDDDILKQGAIRTVLDEIQHNNYSLIIVNSEVRNADLSKLVDKKRLQINENKVYTPEENEKLFVEAANYLSFIGCVVINKRLWDDREKEKYFGTGFVHVGVIFQNPIPSNTLIIAEPYIIIRYGNAEWTTRAFEIWLFKWPNLIWSFPNFSDRAKSQIISKEPYLQYLTLLNYRAKGAYSINEYAKFVAPRLKSQWRRLVSKIIARLPGCFVNFLGTLYFSFFYKTSRLPLMEMKNSRFYYANFFKRGRQLDFND
ncbi:MAG: Abequosyltransferase RfbV [candidate division WS2 bacterium]|nr:Abequosyltransferase RfbV [Candidatus Psychracetigena formicireducens]